MDGIEIKVDPWSEGIWGPLTKCLTAEAVASPKDEPSGTLPSGTKGEEQNHSGLIASVAAGASLPDPSLSSTPNVTTKAQEANGPLPPKASAVVQVAQDVPSLPAAGGAAILAQLRCVTWPMMPPSWSTYFCVLNVMYRTCKVIYYPGRDHHTISTRLSHRRARKAASAAAASSKPSSASVKAATVPNVVFAFASQTGTATEISRSLHAEAIQRGIKAEVMPLNELGMDKLSSTPILVVVASSTGDGDPPDNASAFWLQLRKKQADGMLKGMKFSILGLGDSTYTRFMQVSRSFKSR